MALAPPLLLLLLLGLGAGWVRGGASEGEGESFVQSGYTVTFVTDANVKELVLEWKGGATHRIPFIHNQQYYTFTFARPWQFRGITGIGVRGPTGWARYTRDELIYFHPPATEKAATRCRSDLRVYINVYPSSEHERCLEEFNCERLAHVVRLQWESDLRPITQAQRPLTMAITGRRWDRPIRLTLSKKDLFNGYIDVMLGTRQEAEHIQLVQLLEGGDVGAVVVASFRIPRQRVRQLRVDVDPLVPPRWLVPLQGSLAGWRSTSAPLFR